MASFWVRAKPKPNTTRVMWLKIAAAELMRLRDGIKNGKKDKLTSVDGLDMFLPHLLLLDYYCLLHFLSLLNLLQLIFYVLPLFQSPSNSPFSKFLRNGLLEMLRFHWLTLYKIVQEQKDPITKVMVKCYSGRHCSR